jgi:hypothetical protein
MFAILLYLKNRNKWTSPTYTNGHYIDTKQDYTETCIYLRILFENGQLVHDFINGGKEVFRISDDGRKNADRLKDMDFLFPSLNLDRYM